MKGFIGSISLISLLLATTTQAINNFTNPGSLPSLLPLLFLFPFLNYAVFYIFSRILSFLRPWLTISPAGNTVIQAGGGATTYTLSTLLPLFLTRLTFSISWQVDTSEPTISLILKNPQQDIILINQGRNTGSFIWNVPENLPSGTYTFEIGVGTIPIIILVSSVYNLPLLPSKSFFN